MHISSCKKTYNHETQRAVPLAETLARIEPKVPAAGITRVADITDLDRIGIPVFSCIRPTADDGAITVYNGKGATVEESRISAIMEGIERYSSEIHDRNIRLDTFEMLDGREPAVNPKDFILPADTETGHVLPWVEGWDIANNEPVLVPAQAVFHPLPRNFRQIFRTSTNGLASGNTLEEAIFHALSEVIERDAWSLVEATRDTGPAVTGVSDPVLAEMQEKFAEAQVEVTLRDITSDIGIPTMAAVADDVLLKDPTLLTIGIGTHTIHGSPRCVRSPKWRRAGSPRSTAHAKIRRPQGSGKRWVTTELNGSTGTGLRTTARLITRPSGRLTVTILQKISNLPSGP